MATVTFPSYASILLTGYSQKRESALLRTEMESGPPKVAKIKSRVLTTRSANIYLGSLDDFQNFEHWYANDCNEGASWFQYYDPVYKRTVSARFAEGGYTATPAGAAALEGWVVQAKIETWG